LPSLADIQTRMRDAVVLGTDAEIVPFLIGGRRPAARLTVHRRHYEASLVEAVRRRFPGVIWLVGEAFISAAAREFVRWHPPTGPCIAEYGESFPDFLARHPGSEGVPYLVWFARLEWCLGDVAQAVELPTMRLDDLSGYEAHAILDLVLRAQPGLRYFEAPWPADRLIELFLSGAAPDCYTLEPAWVRLQIQGARGRFRIDRLDPGTFAFRTAIAAGLTLGEAAERALEADASFDPGRALAGFVADGLLRGLRPPAKEHNRDRPHPDPHILVVDGSRLVGPGSRCA
jgi:Putative DNA-binding domain